MQYSCWYLLLSFFVYLCVGPWRQWRTNCWRNTTDTTGRSIRGCSVWRGNLGRQRRYMYWRSTLINNTAPLFYVVVVFLVQIYFTSSSLPRCNFLPNFVLAQSHHYCEIFREKEQVFFFGMCTALHPIFVFLHILTLGRILELFWLQVIFIFV